MAEAAKPKGRFPRSIPYIIGNEAAERFSFYGMRALLAVFFVQQFAFTDAHANEYVHLFISLTYFMSIIGGILADWYLGKYATIFWLSLVYCAGHLCLALFDTHVNGFLFGLLLITFGAGGIKPSVSANVGDQFDKTNQHLISVMFNWFYFAINVGAFVSSLLTPVLMEKYGPKVAFGVPGVLMGLATFIFWLGRKKYVMVPPTGFKRENFIFINAYALKNMGKRKKGMSLLDVAKEKYSAKSVEGIKSVWQVLAVFAFIPIYWALYDQSASEWVLQAGNMNLNFLGHTWLPAQIQSVNAVLILAFIPLFTYGIYPLVEKIGIKVTPLRKMGAGFIVMILTFVLVAMIQMRIDAGHKPDIAWQILAYAALTASEILVSITGLEYAYTQAPKSMKSTIMSFWLFTVFVGDLFDTLVNQNINDGGFLSHLKGADFYWFFTAILAAFTIVYLIVSKFIKEKSYLIGSEEDPDLAQVAVATNDSVLEH